MNSQLEVENARNLSVDQLAGTFIPTKLFDQLLSASHQVLLGARGQGKTALFRMLSFDGLSVLAETDEWVRSTIDERKYIGIYLPTKLEWIQSLASQADGEIIAPAKAFLWKLNLSSCIALLITAASCVRYYCQDQRMRTIKELSFCRKVSVVWHLGCLCESFDSVTDRLKELSFAWQVEISRRGMMGAVDADMPLPSPLDEAFAVFSTPSFEPLIQGIRVIAAELGLSNTTAWLLCIDEAEWMSSEQQRVVNSFMRVAPESNLFLKIATLPFSHYTLETAHGQAPLVPGQDFDYIHMDFGGAEVLHMDEAERRWGKEYAFGEILFERLMAKHFPDVSARYSSLTDLLGDCPLLDRDLDQDWSEDSVYMSLLREYANESFLSRAEAQLDAEAGNGKFMDSIGRKVKGALLLRDDSDKRVGHKKSALYSGARMVIKCADGNPRVFIRILKNLLKTISSDFAVLRVNPSKQEDVLRGLAENFLNQIKSYQNVGQDLHKIVVKLGNYISRCLYGRKLTGDIVGSFSIAEPAHDDEKSLDLLKAAVRYGVIKPNDSVKVNYGGNTIIAGDYHLSYTFCPYFRTLPRKGTTVSLRNLVHALDLPDNGKKDSLNQMLLWDAE